MRHQTTDEDTKPEAHLRHFLESAGGFTLHRRTGQPVRTGVSVCADPDASLSFPLGDWDDDRVGTWFRSCLERLRGSDLHLGGWLDPTTGWVCLDVVRVYPPHRRREALRLGRAHRQKAAFDLSQGCVLGLTGPIVAGLTG